jgi:hypothetical protein
MEELQRIESRLSAFQKETARLQEDLKALKAPTRFIPPSDWAGMN